MRHIISSSFYGLWTFVFFANLAFGEPIGPKISLIAPVYDFGRVTEGIVVEHDFVIRNDGDQPLQILKVEPSCGCTVAKLAKDRILPSETTLLSVTFNTDGFWGNEIKVVRVYTDDLRQRSSELAIQGVVEREISLNPPRLYFGRVSRGKADSRQLSIVSSEPETVQVTKVESASEFIVLSGHEVDKGASKLQVGVRLAENVPLGAFKSRLILYTTSTKHPVIVVPVFARVTGDIQSVPGEISFGLRDGPLLEPLKGETILTNYGIAPRSVTSVTSSDPRIEAKVRVLEDGRKFALDIAVAQSTEGTLNAKINIEFDHTDAEQAVVSVPVYAIVSRRNSEAN